MRNFLAALTLAVVTLVHVVDPMVCRDGCDEVASHESADACLLCHLGVSAAPQVTAERTVSIETQDAQEQQIEFLLQLSAQIDHPPRTA